MDKIKYIKLERADGSYSEGIPISIDANYVSTLNGSSNLDSDLKKINTDINSNNKSVSNLEKKIINLNNEITNMIDGTPLIANGILEMTDTSKIYVNSENGYLYYYYNNTWVNSNLLYQSEQIASGKVGSDQISDITKGMLKITSYEKHKPVPNWGSFSVENGIVVTGSGSNHTRGRMRISVNSSNPKVIFNNKNNDLKISIAFCYRTDDGTEYVKEYYRFNEYVADHNEWIGTSPMINSVRVAVAYVNDQTITTEEERDLMLDNITVIDEDVTELTSTNIKKGSLEMSDIRNILTNKNILPPNIYFYSIGDSAFRIYNYENTERAFQYTTYAFSPKKNTKYYFKTDGTNNRLSVVGTYTWPSFPDVEYNPNAPSEPLSSSYFLIRNLEVENLTEGEFFNTDFNYIFLYINNNNEEIHPKMMVSESPINEIEEYEIKIPGLVFDDSTVKLESLYYTNIPDSVTRELFYYESEFTSSQEMQGLATDGTYLYYCMHGDTDDDTSCIGKINIETREVVVKKNDTCYRHCNGCCYYPKDHTLYVASLMDWDTEYPDFYILDADTLEQVGTVKLDNLADQWENFTFIRNHGCGAIAYSQELDRFIVLLRPTTRATGEPGIFGFAIYTTNWQLDKMMKYENPIRHQFRGGLWADGKYIYTVSNLKDPNTDVITIMDYHGNIVEFREYTEFNRTTFEGIVVDYENNCFYTSNANDRIYKFNINSYKNISKAEVFNKYSLN